MSTALRSDGVAEPDPEVPDVPPRRVLPARARLVGGGGEPPALLRRG
ncbi:hypothetical protein ABTX81_06850 [Kitasatospora sp. NPDC097605]